MADDIQGNDIEKLMQMMTSLHTKIEGVETRMEGIEIRMEEGRQALNAGLKAQGEAIDRLNERMDGAEHRERAAERTRRAEHRADAELRANMPMVAPSTYQPMPIRQASRSELLSEIDVRRDRRISTPLS